MLLRLPEPNEGMGPALRVPPGTLRCGAICPRGEFDLILSINVGAHLLTEAETVVYLPTCEVRALSSHEFAGILLKLMPKRQDLTDRANSLLRLVRHAACVDWRVSFLQRCGQAPPAFFQVVGVDGAGRIFLHKLRI